MTIPESLVKAGRWLHAFSEHQTREPLLPTLDGWDPVSTLHLSREVRLNAGAIREACRLSESDVLLLATQVDSDAQIRRCVHRAEIGLEGDEAHVVDFRVHGGDLSGRLILRTEILLGSPGHSADVFAARLPGSRLWSDSHVTEIEGSRSQFPVQALDFESVPWIPARSAPWHLDVDRIDPKAPFLGCVRLYLNAGHPLIKDIDVQPLVQSMLQYEVMRSILATVVPEPAFREEAGRFDEGSLGSVVENMARIVFLDMSLEDVARLIEHDPPTFDTMVREAMELLDV